VSGDTGPTREQLRQHLKAFHSGIGRGIRNLTDLAGWHARDHELIDRIDVLVNEHYDAASQPVPSGFDAPHDPLDYSARRVDRS
jgi:hypothetical protein